MNILPPPIKEHVSFASFMEEVDNADLYKDKDGNPVVFYRGTQSKDNLFTNLGTLSFTTDPNVAKIYSARPKTTGMQFTADFVKGSTVGSYYLKMTNPIEADEIDGTPLDFIENYMGGVKAIGEANVLKLLAYLANRESGKAKGPRFLYDFHDDASDYIDPDGFMGVEIGPSLKSLYTSVKKHYQDGSMADVKDALDAVTIDYFVMFDAPVFKHLAKAAGYDGIIHSDAFDAGPMVSKKLVGQEVGDRHLTYRPFNMDQVVPIKIQSMAPKEPTTESLCLEGWEMAPIQDMKYYDQEDNEFGFYYHVTTKEAAPSIIQHGLKPGHAPMFQGYKKRSSNKVFLTDIDGLFEWMRIVKAAMRERGKDAHIAVLRIPKSEVDGKIKLHCDRQGSKETDGNAWYAKQPIGESIPGPLTMKKVMVETSTKTPKPHRDLDDIDVSSIDTGVPVKGYLYHGSRRDDLEELEPYSPSYDGSLGWGLYLAEKPEAENYGKYVYRVPVELKNPFRIEHEAIEADPTGDDLSTRINWELQEALKEAGIKFKDWYEQYAGHGGAEWEQPYGDDVQDAIDENGELPEAFMDWLEEDKRPQVKAIAKKVLEIDEWYSEIMRKTLKGIDMSSADGYKEYQEKRKAYFDQMKEKLGKAGLETLEALWDEWPANNIPSIASSTLTGEHVPPFWFRLGDEIIGCFDADDMEYISSSVREAGYDSMVVEGLRFNSGFLGHEVVLFRSAVPDQIDGQPIQPSE